MNENDKRVMFSSNSDEWATPQAFFDKYNELYSFNTDVCANEGNAKCKHYFSKEQDGLKQDWKGVCFCNPPYGRGITTQWVKKAYEESLKGNIIVCLLPARTDTKWFHEYCIPYGTIEFVKGRLKFGDQKNSAPFPSMVVIFGET